MRPCASFLLPVEASRSVHEDEQSGLSGIKSPMKRYQAWAAQEAHLVVAEAACGMAALIF